VPEETIDIALRVLNIPVKVIDPDEFYYSIDPPMIPPISSPLVLLAPYSNA